MDTEPARSDLEYIRRTMQSVWIISFVMGAVFHRFSISRIRCRLVAAVLQLLLPQPSASLVFGFSCISLQLVPGLVLTRIHRRERNGAA